MKKKTKSDPDSNLTKNETNALQQLSQRDDIIIIKAVKGGAVVIIDINDYIHEDNQHLNISHFYGKYQMTQ